MLFDTDWMGHDVTYIPDQVLRDAVVFPVMDVRTITFENPDYTPYVGLGLFVGESAAVAQALPMFWCMLKPGEPREVVQDVLLDWFRSTGIRLGRIPAVNPTFMVQSRVSRANQGNRYAPAPQRPVQRPAQRPQLIAQPVPQPAQPVSRPVSPRPQLLPPQQVQVQPPSPQPSAIPSITTSLLDQFAKIARGAIKLFEPIEYEEDEVQMTDIDFLIDETPVAQHHRTDRCDTIGWFDQEGKIKETRVRELIFHGGLKSEDRRVLWPLLLDVYPWTSTEASRSSQEESDRIEYETLKAHWNRVLEVGKDVEKPSEDSLLFMIRDWKYRIEKDVIRTDHAISFYHTTGTSQEWTRELEALRDILVTYTFSEYLRFAKKEGIENVDGETVRGVTTEELGYCQGMADLATPLYAELLEESVAFRAYAGLLARIGRNFNVDQTGMQRQLAQLDKLMRFMDPVLHRHFIDIECGHYFFAFRWLLIWFRREFNYRDTLDLWEVLFTRHVGDYPIFIAYAILQVYRDELMACKAFDEVLKCVNDLSEKMDLKRVLEGAEIGYNGFKARYVKWQGNDDPTMKHFHFNGPVSSDELRSLGFEWRRTHNRIVPVGAIECGYEAPEKGVMVVARVHQRGIFPAKAPCGGLLNGAFFANGGREVLSSKWDCLVDARGWKKVPIEWKSVHGALDNVAGVVNAEGMDESGTPVYFARVRKEGGLHLGYVAMGDDEGCCFSWGGKQLYSQDYEVMRMKSDLDWMEDLAELL
jgi:hypothetical protein